MLWSTPSISREPSICRDTIQIDPTFAYYLNRSEASVAAELEQAGYSVVRLFVTDETRVNGRLVEVLRERGLEVWAMALGNGTYGTAHLPPEWSTWQMELLKPVHDGYFRLSPHSTAYTAWKKSALAQLVRRYPFTGLEIAECYFPEWNGLATGTYGDIGPLAQSAFVQFGGGVMPEFKHRSSPYYYKKDRGRYLLWIDFRVQAVNRFIHELINGTGGVRDANPAIKIATWSLAVDAGRDSVAALREIQGMDASEMIRLVQPDMHVIQTHWPDWMRSRLPADYIKRYEPFVKQIRGTHPTIPLGIQTDIGSLPRMRRSRDWLNRFASACEQQGYGFWTAYEYTLGRYMADDPPVPVFAARLDDKHVYVDFNKRIDPQSTDGSFTVRAQSDPHSMETLKVIEVDGQRVTLQSSHFSEQAFEIVIKGVRDTPVCWLFPNQRANDSPPGCRISVPAV